MKRQALPGIIGDGGGFASLPWPDGIFLVRLDHAQHRWHPQKPFYVLRLLIVEPNQFAGMPIVSRLYCTTKAMWKLGWFLRDFLYDPESLTRDEIDEKALRGLIGVVKISHTVLNGVSLVNFDGFAPASQWEELSAGFKVPSSAKLGGVGKRKVSYDLQLFSDFSISDLPASISSQVSRWLAGEEHRASMLFGRAFEQAVAALFRHEDPAASCSSNGVLTSSWRRSTRHVKLGTACCNRACICSNVSSRTVESASADRERSSRSSSLEH